MTDPTTVGELAAKYGVGSNYFLGMDFSQLILSGYFPIFLGMIVAMIVFVPFGVVGIRHVMTWFSDNFMKPGKGYIRVVQRLPNDRMRRFWVLPTGKMMKFKSIDGRDIEQPINTEKGYMLFDGNIPTIELDPHNKQIFMGPGKEQTTISQEEITRGYKLAYDTGKMVGAVDAFAEMKLWIIIGVGVAVMGMMISGYMGFTISEKIDKLPHIDQQELARQTALEFLNITSSSQQKNPAVPTVGGK